MLTSVCILIHLICLHTPEDTLKNLLLSVPHTHIQAHAHARRPALHDAALGCWSLAVLNEHSGSFKLV